MAAQRTLFGAMNRMLRTAKAKEYVRCSEQKWAVMMRYTIAGRYLRPNAEEIEQQRDAAEVEVANGGALNVLMRRFAALVLRHVVRWANAMKALVLMAALLAVCGLLNSFRDTRLAIGIVFWSFVALAVAYFGGLSLLVADAVPEDWEPRD